MYKLLLSWRYLRTRWIALASIISVTLGVATMIVVNSVMDGFTQEMHTRMHEILSDVVVESHSLGGIPDAHWHEQEIRQVLGDDIAGLTCAVRVPAMINFQVRGQWITQQVMLTGIDDATYAEVSNFSRYLLHPENRKHVSFDLREEGYDATLPESGWEHRRKRVEYERAYREQLQQLEQARRNRAADRIIAQAGFFSEREAPDGSPTVTTTDAAPPILSPPPFDVPADNVATESPAATTDAPTNTAPPESPASPTTDPFQKSHPISDPFSQHLPDGSDESQIFDEAKEQYTGLVLGIAIGSVRHRGLDGKVKDTFLVRPGDDVQITFPNSGQPPKAISEKFTVVDMYESKMSEYDSTFAFVPLSALQKMRGMIDPMRGTASVTTIQLKLRPGTDLNMVRDKLRTRFPAEQFAYRIETWRDMQGPLLAAVKMETTILNILLFLIIAVAGFGILATFFMIVVEKTKDIGILKSLGAPSGGVASIFLTYGLSLGVVGAGVGMVLGVLFVVYINQIAAGLEWITGREVFDPTIYYFQQIPTVLDPFTVVWVSLGAVLIAVLASVLPSIRAARLHPVEALRYE